MLHLFDESCILFPHVFRVSELKILVATVNIYHDYNLACPHG